MNICTGVQTHDVVRHNVTSTTCAVKNTHHRTPRCSCSTIMSDAESSDEDYDFHTTGNDLQGEDDEARYPIHDYCEFEDVEALKVRSCIALQVAAQNVAIDHGALVCLST